MISVPDQKVIENGKIFATFFGTSSDNKPIDGIATGSSFVEVDTGKAFLFNESTSAWVEQ